VWGGSVERKLWGQADMALRGAGCQVQGCQAGGGTAGAEHACLQPRSAGIGAGLHGAGGAHRCVAVSVLQEWHLAGCRGAGGCLCRQAQYPWCGQRSAGRREGAGWGFRRCLVGHLAGCSGWRSVCCGPGRWQATAPRQMGTPNPPGMSGWVLASQK
jgi:hypothetical protein